MMGDFRIWATCNLFDIPGCFSIRKAIHNFKPIQNALYVANLSAMVIGVKLNWDHYPGFDGLAKYMIRIATQLMAANMVKAVR